MDTISIISKEYDTALEIHDVHNIFYYTLRNEMIVYYTNPETQTETYKTFALDKIINFSTHNIKEWKYES